MNGKVQISISNFIYILPFIHESQGGVRKGLSIHWPDSLSTFSFKKKKSNLLKSRVVFCTIKYV